MNEGLALVDHCRAITFETLPQDVIERVKYLFLDYLGVTFRGAGTESAECVQSFIKKHPFAISGNKGSAVIGTAIRADPLYAAIANGIAAHSIECDDVINEGSLHPAVTIMTTALSCADFTDGLSGKDFIEAVVTGYESVIRLGIAVNPASHYARGFHPTATCGTFGSAVTAAKILKLSKSQMINALGISGSQAAGSMEYLTDGVYTKRFHPGWASHSGMIAALLAREGLTGPKTIIEGKFGFLNGYSDHPKPDELLKAWGTPYKVMKTGIKPYACCRYKQGPIDCVLSIVKQHGLSPGDIKKVHAGVLSAGFPLVAEPIEKKQCPETIVDAQFSMPFGAAVAILRGNASLGEYSLENINASDIRNLMKRVECYQDSTLDERFPEKWPATARIETRDGRILHHQIEYPKGDPENPLTWDELRNKFRDMVSTTLGENQMGTIIQYVNGLDQLPDVRLISKQMNVNGK